MGKDEIYLISFDQTINGIGEMKYKDDGIAIYTDIRQLPFAEHAIRLDMFAIAVCIKGKIQVELNAETYTIHQNEVLVFKSNDVISDCMASPDFDGAVLFLSQRYLMEQISESDLWNSALRLLKSPVIHVTEASIHLFILYGKILQEKMEQEPMPFRKEIITSVVKAILYELLTNTVAESKDTPDCKLQLDKAGNMLFKRFIELLAGSRVKPRSVTWYADTLCITPKYLSTVCKEVTGKTASCWINEYVLIDIRHWLKNSNKTIKEIADLLEFPNISFFGKYCRAHFGVSPKELRKRLREQPDEEAIAFPDMTAGRQTLTD